MSKWIAVIATFVIFWALTPAAWATCPDGLECLHEAPTHCLHADQLEAHQRNLTECERRADRMEGRLEECRDSVQPLQVRIEELTADLARERQAHSRTVEEVGRWYRNPWILGGVALGLGGAGFVVGVVVN